MCNDYGNYVDCADYLASFSQTRIPVIEQIRARGSIDPERVIEALAEAIPREFGTDPVRIPLQAIVFEASRR
jgi:hypothetical protein